MLSLRCESTVKPKSGNPLTRNVRLVTLGALSLSVDGLPVLAGRRKVLVLLAYLACHPQRKLERAFLADLGWPDTPDARARASLRQALSELREAIGPALLTDGELVGLAPGMLTIDLHQFLALADSGNHEGALQLWQGEFLPGADDDRDRRTTVVGRGRAGIAPPPVRLRSARSR